MRNQIRCEYFSDDMGNHATVIEDEVVELWRQPKRKQNFIHIRINDGHDQGPMISYEHAVKYLFSLGYFRS